MALLCRSACPVRARLVPPHRCHGGLSGRAPAVTRQGRHRLRSLHRKRRVDRQYRGESSEDILRRPVRAGLSLGASRRRLLTHVVLPTTLSSIFTGLRIAIGVSWMSIVGAELIAASSGLGYMINYYQQVLRTDLVIVGMITIGVIGLVMDLASRWIERLLLPWRQGVRLP